MKSEYENFMKINEFNKRKLLNKEKEEFEGDSDEISVEYGDKIVANLIEFDDDHHAKIRIY
jgi:hypothetical protein